MALALSSSGEIHWTEDKEKTLIAFFSKHSCLWNHKSKGYKNQTLRWQILEQLRVLLCAQTPPASLTVEDIKSKFKNLRTTFQRQYKMVKASKACDKEFVPLWKHYQELMFLTDCWEQDYTSEDPPLSPLSIPQQASPPVLTSQSQTQTSSFVPTPSTSSSSCIPINITVKYHWTEERECALISFYSEHSCLWNHKSKGYKNQTLRWQILEQLRVLLCAQTPPASLTVEDIKSKFKNLRTTFQRQYKMVKASKACDKEFVPLWKHYQELMFLTDCWEQDYTSEDPPLSPLSIPQQASPPVLTSQSQTQTSSFVPTPSTSSSSCIPINITVKYHWTEERECALISFYSEHNCLWNMKSENHNNRQLRLRLFEALKNQLSDHSVSFSVEDIKYKFKNLRTVFNREHKAVQASLASDKPYVSKWKHYLQLLFLAESCALDNSPEHLLMQSYQDDKDVEQGKLTSSFAMGTFSSNFNQNNSLRLYDSPCTSSQSDTKPKERTAPGNFSSLCPENLQPGSEMATQTLLAISLNSSPDTKAHALTLPLTSGSRVEPPAENKLTAESCCLWTEAKVQELISFYSKHGCLWNHRSESYRNCTLRQNLLETLSNILSDSETISVEDIKTKFSNLRTIFQREHKAASFNKTCGSGDFYLPKWKHYSDLMFLCDSCDEDELPENNQRLDDASQTTSPSASKHSSSSSSPSHTGSHVSGRKRGSRHLTSTNSEVVEILRTFYQNQTASPHAGFLKYVEECLNETPQDKVKMMKKRIIDTIHSVMEQG